MTYREWFENLRHNLRAAGDENKALDCDSVLEEEDGHWGSAENAMVEQARDEALERLTLASWPDDSEASWVLPQFWDSGDKLDDRVPDGPQASPGNSQARPRENGI